MDVLVFILIVIGCILCHKLSSSYDHKIQDKYYQGCINWWWSAIVAVLLAATLFTIGEESFYILLMLTLAGAAISAIVSYRKMIGFGATQKEAACGCVAQIASAIGIAAAIVFILFLFFGPSNKKRRRR